MATGVHPARRDSLRQWLRGDAPASRAAFLFMFVSALLCGAALSGLLFVGVWRHTAGEAAANQAARIGDQQALAASRRTTKTLRARLAHEQQVLAKTAGARAAATASLARARTALAQAQAALSRAKAADAASLHSLSLRVAGLSGAASTLARATATLRSELTSLQSYAANPGPTGIDPGYLATQVRYLEASAAAASAAAGSLSSRVADLQR